MDSVNVLRVLAADMVAKANSGHPGMPMGMADLAYILFKEFINFNPKDPAWPNRDRFVLSNGHGSALLYTCLHLLGYEKMTLEQLKNFRKLHSLTKGHPELDVSAGIETTTGPLGQGIANAVGFAIAERHLNARFGNELINHKTYVFCGDGCLMEGISYEAMSLAGHLALKNLILVYDNNNISIDGSTNLSFSENIKSRMDSINWELIEIDGHNHDEIRAAYQKAQNANKPVLISARTTIGFGSPSSKLGTAKVHGSPLSFEEMKEVRKNLNWNHAPFQIPQDVKNEWLSFSERCSAKYQTWNDSFKKNGHELAQLLNKSNLENIWELTQEFISEEISKHNNEATRASSGKFLEFISPKLKNLIGGSADLTGSNNTKASSQQIFSKENYNGSYIHYGVREHAMCSIINGINTYGALIAYGGTFLAFSDYARPAIRLAALSQVPSIFIMTHDSIGLGEDGPTHQPVEHLASLRAIPNLNVFRPADVIETAECYDIALSSNHTPSVFALSRQNLPQLRSQKESSNLSSLGAYIIKEFQGNLDITLYASGSELSIAFEVEKILNQHSLGVRIVSVPCMDLFYDQDPEYQMMFTCNKSLKVAIEAGISQGWERLIGAHGMFFGMHTFGESATIKALYKHFGLTPENISTKILNVLNR